MPNAGARWRTEDANRTVRQDVHESNYYGARAASVSVCEQARRCGARGECDEADKHNGNAIDNALHRPNENKMNDAYRACHAAYARDGKHLQRKSQTGEMLFDADLPASAAGRAELLALLRARVPLPKQLLVVIEG